jgi:hypothetical protein
MIVTLAQTSEAEPSHSAVSLAPAYASSGELEDFQAWGCGCLSGFESGDLRDAPLGTLGKLAVALEGALEDTVEDVY